MSRRQVFTQRLAALWADVVALTLVLTIVVLALVPALDMDVTVSRVLAGSTGLLLLVAGMGTLSLAVGAATGRRGVALATAAGVTVAAFMLDAIGPAVEVEWMTAISPFSWYLGNNPLVEGWDAAGLAKLALVPAVAAAGGWRYFGCRDLLV